MESVVADEHLFEKMPSAMEAILQEINKAILSGNIEAFSILDIVTNEDSITINMGLDIDKIVIKKDDDITSEQISAFAQVVQKLKKLRIPLWKTQQAIKKGDDTTIVAALTEDVAEAKVKQQEDKGKEPDRKVGELVDLLKQVPNKLKALFARKLVDAGSAAPSTATAEATKAAEAAEATKAAEATEEAAAAAAAEAEEAAKKAKQEEANAALAVQLAAAEQPAPVEAGHCGWTAPEGHLPTILEYVYAITYPAKNKQGKDVTKLDVITSANEIDYTNNIQVYSIMHSTDKTINMPFKKVRLDISKNINETINDIISLYDFNVAGLNEMMKTLTTYNDLDLTGGPFNFVFNNFICQHAEFDNVDIVETIGDGTCLVHSFLQATSTSYRKVTRMQKVLIAKIFRLGVLPQILKKAKNIFIEEINNSRKEEILDIIVDTDEFLEGEIYTLLADYYKYNYIIFNEGRDNLTIQPYKSICDTTNNFRTLLFYNKGQLHFASMANIMEIDNNGYIGNARFDLDIPTNILGEDLSVAKIPPSRYLDGVKIDGDPVQYYIYKLGYKNNVGIDRTRCRADNYNAAILIKLNSNHPVKSLDRDGSGNLIKYNSRGHRIELKLKDGLIDIVTFDKLDINGTPIARPINASGKVIVEAANAAKSASGAEAVEPNIAAIEAAEAAQAAQPAETHQNLPPEQQAAAGLGLTQENTSQEEPKAEEVEESVVELIEPGKLYYYPPLKPEEEPEFAGKNAELRRTAIEAIDPTIPKPSMSLWSGIKASLKPPKNTDLDKLIKNRVVYTFDRDGHILIVTKSNDGKFYYTYRIDVPLEQLPQFNWLGKLLISDAEFAHLAKHEHWVELILRRELYEKILENKLKTSSITNNQKVLSALLDYKHPYPTLKDVLVDAGIVHTPDGKKPQPSIVDWLKDIFAKKKPITKEEKGLQQAVGQAEAAAKANVAEKKNIGMLAQEAAALAANAAEQGVVSDTSELGMSSAEQAAASSPEQVLLIARSAEKEANSAGAAATEEAAAEGASEAVDATAGLAAIVAGAATGATAGPDAAEKVTSIVAPKAAAKGQTGSVEQVAAAEGQLASIGQAQQPQVAEALPSAQPETLQPLRIPQKAELPVAPLNNQQQPSTSSSAKQSQASSRKVVQPPKLPQAARRGAETEAAKLKKQQEDITSKLASFGKKPENNPEILAELAALQEELAKGPSTEGGKRRTKKQKKNKQHNKSMKSRK